jgi:hypothetical protein
VSRLVDRLAHLKSTLISGRAIWTLLASSGPLNRGMTTSVSMRQHELDVLADHAPEHLLHVRDDLVDVEDPRLQHLLATECQELPREAGGPFGGLLDLLDPLPTGVLGPRSFVACQPWIARLVGTETATGTGTGSPVLSNFANSCGGRGKLK